MLLPPLGYRADARETVAFYRAVADASTLPIMAYNNPEASGVDMPPALIARIAAEVEQVVAIKECSGDARRIAALLDEPDLEVLVGGDDWALEGFCAGATGWVTGVADCAPAECVELHEACRAGRARARPRDLRAAAPAGAARHDAEAGAVLQGRAGRARLHRRPGPRAAAALDDDDRAVLDAARCARAAGARRRARDARGALVRRGRLPHGGDADARGRRRRGADPGATMLERKLHFEAELDDLRLLLMREPRGHGAMSGAILQPPTRADADWGVLFIEVSGCLPMCGHGTIGVATVLVETGMVEVREPETVVRLDTPAGLVEARVAVAGRPRRAVTLRNVPSFLAAPIARSRCPGSARVRYDMAFGGNFYAILPAADVGLEVDPARARRADRRRAGDHRRDRRDRPAGPSGGRADRRLRHVVLHAPGRDGADARAATSIHPGWLDRSPCGTGTSARLAQLHGARRARGRRHVRQRVGDRHALHRADREETTVGGRPAIVPEITGRAWITAMGQYLLDAEDPFPAGFAL